MFSIDDRAGNVVTTGALFLLGATILYVARGAFLILVLSLLFAYLLAPGVTAVQQHSRLGRKNRTWAIAQVYLVGALLLGGLGWQLGPHLIAQVKGFKTALPEILQSISGEKTSDELQAKHGLSAAQQQKVRDWLAHNHDSIAQVFERVAESAAYVAARAVWLFAIPVLAIFILRDGRSMTDATIRALAGKSHDTRVERTLRRVDGLLAKLFMTLSPQIAGRNVNPIRPALVQGVAFVPDSAPWFQLLSVKQKAEHLYLRYRRIGVRSRCRKPKL